MMVIAGMSMTQCRLRLGAALTVAGKRFVTQCFFAPPGESAENGGRAARRNRDCHIESDFSFAGVREARVLEQLRQRERRSNLTQVENGPEFVSKALDS